MAKSKKRDVVNQEEIQEGAERFKALGDPTRLRIIRYLWYHETGESNDRPTRSALTDENADDDLPETPTAGAAGAITVGDIAQYVTGEKKITSTVSHHLKELRQAGLITLERSGKKKHCHLNYDTLSDMILLLGGNPSAYTYGRELPKNSSVLSPSQKITSHNNPATGSENDIDPDGKAHA